MCLQLLPYTAACPASYPYQCLTRVVLGDGHLFAALWEGKGGSQAARHCVSVCYDLVVEGIKSGADPSAAMQKACQQMDEAYFASELTDLVRTVAVLTAIQWGVGPAFPDFEQQSSTAKLLESLHSELECNPSIKLPVKPVPPDKACLHCPLAGQSKCRCHWNHDVAGHQDQQVPRHTPGQGRAVCHCQQRYDCCWPLLTLPHPQDTPIAADSAGMLTLGWAALSPTCITSRTQPNCSAP